MSTSHGHHWADALATFAHRGEGQRKSKPKRHDVQHRLNFLDDARMAREMGHL